MTVCQNLTLLNAANAQLCATGYIMGYTNNLLGIIIGAHRYYSHRCFKASRAMRVLMVLSQTATSQVKIRLSLSDVL